MPTITNHGQVGQPEREKPGGTQVASSAKAGGPRQECAPEAVLGVEHGDRLGPTLGPEPNWNLVAPAARALCSPGSAQTGRRHQVPEHLQPGQAVPGVQGCGYRLEGPGEPGKAGRKGRFLSLLGDARKPGGVEGFGCPGRKWSF